MQQRVVNKVIKACKSQGNAKILLGLLNLKTVYIHKKSHIFLSRLVVCNKNQPQSAVLRMEQNETLSSYK